MKTLIIDNYFKGAPEQVVNAVKSLSKYKLLSYENIRSDYKLENFDAVILTGSAARIIRSKDVKKFEGVIDLLKRANLPCLGICYGHQLMSLTLGAEVASLGRKIKKFERVRIIKKDGLFDGFELGQEIPLAESHYDYVKKDSLPKAGLTLLADSNSCKVEAVKHKRKPFYGVQFHPERWEIGSETHKEGLKVIKNFYQHCVNV